MQQNENEKNLLSGQVEILPEDVRQYIIEPWIYPGLKGYRVKSETLPTYEEVLESDRQEGIQMLISFF